MLGWDSGRFHINEDQLATATDRLLVCGVKKPRSSVRTIEPPPAAAESIVRSARPSATIGTLVFCCGGVLGFFAVLTWPF